MTDKRFNELVNGALGHPEMVFRLSRLVLALRNVVEVCGEAGENALEAHCSTRAEQDARYSVEFDMQDELPEC